MSCKKRYIKQVFLISSMMFLLVASLAYIIDPYKMFHSYEINHINQIRPKKYDYSMKDKYVKALKFNPEIVILGSSRTEIGIDTSLKSFENKVVMNLSYPKLRAEDLRVYFEAIVKNTKVKDVYLGLDFLMFNALIDKKRTPNIDNLIKYYFEHLFSFKTLKDIFFTIKASIYKENLADDKKSNHKEFGFRYKLKKMDNISQKALFFAYEVYYFFGEMWLEKQTRNFLFFDKKTSLNTLDELKKIYDIAYSNDINLHVFITPSHARLWSSIYMLGLWEKWHFWKKQIVILNEEVANKYDMKPYILYDFSGFNRVTTEKLPDLNDNKSKMKNYIDASHFTPAIGVKIINAILNSKGDFGTKINSKNIEKHLNLENKLRKDFFQKRKKDILELYILFNDKRNKNLVENPFLDILNM